MEQNTYISNNSKESFISVIKQYRNIITDNKLRKNYDDFISKYEHTYNNAIMPWMIGELDPKLLIIYAPYFIKTFGFPDWYNAFAVTKDNNILAYLGEDICFFSPTKAHRYLNFIQRNVNHFSLNKTEKEIVLKGKPIELADYDKNNYGEWRYYWFIEDTTFLLMENRIYTINEYLKKYNTCCYQNNKYRYPLWNSKYSFNKQIPLCIYDNRYVNNSPNVDRGFEPSGDTGVENTEHYIIGLERLVKKFEKVLATPFAAIGRLDGSYSILCSADGRKYTNSEIEDILKNYENFRSSIIIPENEIKQLEETEISY